MTELIDRLRHCSMNCDDEYIRELCGKSASEIERLRKAMSDAIREASQPHYGEKYIQIDNYDDAILILEKALEGKP